MKRVDSDRDNGRDSDKDIDKGTNRDRDSDRDSYREREKEISTPRRLLYALLAAALSVPMQSRSTRPEGRGLGGLPR